MWLLVVVALVANICEESWTFAIFRCPRLEIENIVKCDCLYIWFTVPNDLDHFSSLPLCKPVRAIG